ncbi:hypothetical protein RRG08_056815 [Elysia crispata]|uniref:Uncharacterized protein n=1 Tax=Elysia crispata TaxID=231223 RepID=A0AAE1DVU4_9GAST|nr:hypothetical protein RRG08_056815 [Elysia crispata]
MFYGPSGLSFDKRAALKDDRCARIPGTVGFPLRPPWIPVLAHSARLPGIKPAANNCIIFGNDRMMNSPLVRDAARDGNGTQPMIGP